MAVNTKKLLRIVPKKTQEWREYERGCLLENGIALNQTATYIWKMCDGKTTVEEICKKLTEKYTVLSTEATKDVIKCINLLLAEGGLSG